MIPAIGLIAYAMDWLDDVGFWHLADKPTASEFAVLGGIDGVIGRRLVES
jgi:hypothetical protein